MSKGKWLLIPIIAFAIIFFAAAMLLAGTTGKVSGIVKDKSTGEPLPGVAVSIVGTTLGSLTNAEGEFVILNVPVGDYRLKAQLVGFTSHEVADLAVSVDLTTIYNFILEPLTLASGEVVVAKAERPLIRQDQTASMTVVQEAEVKQMPTRGYQDVVGLRAGVVAFKENQATRGRLGPEVTNEPRMNIRGGRPSDVVYYVDGFAQQDPLSGISTTAIGNNSIKEIQIMTGGFNAEYGRASAGVINVTTQEGSKDYHGNMEIVTDNFHSQSYDYNVYSFDLTGPILPDLTDVSFYASGERRWQRDRDPKATAERVPSNLTGLDEGILPNNYRDGYTWQGKLRYDLAPQATLRFGTLGSIDRWQEYVHAYLFVKDHMPRYEDKNNSHYLKLTHSLSRNMFYNLSLNYYSTERTRGDGVHFDDLFGYGRPDGGGGMRYDDYTRLFRPWDDPSTPNVDESYTTTYLHRESSYYGLKFDMTSQINSSNELKFGAEYLRHTLRYYTNLTPFNVYYEYGEDSSLVLHPGAFTEVNNYGYDITGTNEIDAGWNGAKHPYEIAVYVQDKLEWEGLILNAGIRYDYFNANTLRLVNELSPLDPYLKGADENATPTEIEEGQKLTEADLEDSKGEHQLSPRFGIAYPVSNNTHFRVSYGKFFQRPELQYLYVSYDYMEYKAKEGSYYPIGNPNLNPEQTTAYEIGITHRLNDRTRLDLTAYYKDVKDLTVLERQENIDPNLPAMTWYRNRDFGTIKGVEANLKMRRTRNIALDLSYSLSWATGTGSDATSLDNITWLESERPLRVSPLDYDQRHKLTGILDIRSGDGEGPVIGDFRPLENAGVNMVINVASGTRYTPTEVSNEVTLEANWPRPVSTINSRSGPWTYRVDLKANRSFELFNLGFEAYVWVLNLFDRKNVIDVYEGTGRPDETGFLATEEGQDWAASRQEPNDLGYTGEQLYNLRQGDPLNYDIPRLVRLGLRLSF